MLTPQQLAMRMQGVGSSEISSIVGIKSPKAKTAHDVYLKKRGLVPDEPPTLAMKLGTICEHPIAELYAEEMNCKLVTSPTIIHPDYPWALCTPDRLWETKERLLEIKWVGWRMVHLWDPHDPEGVPGYVHCQCQWQMTVKGWKECHVAVVLGGEEFKVFQLQHSEKLERVLLDEAERFWLEHVVPGVPPAVDDTESARNMLEVLFRQKTGVFIPSTDLTEAWIDKLMTAQRAKAEADRLETEAQNHLIDEIRENDGIESPRGKVHYKVAGTNKRRTFRFFEKKTPKAKAPKEQAA